MFWQRVVSFPALTSVDDELDALAKAHGGVKSKHEREQTLHQLLTETNGRLRQRDSPPALSVYHCKCTRHKPTRDMHVVVIRRWGRGTRRQVSFSMRYTLRTKPTPSLLRTCSPVRASCLAPWSFASFVECSVISTDWASAPSGWADISAYLVLGGSVGSSTLRISASGV